MYALEAHLEGTSGASILHGNYYYLPIIVALGSISIILIDRKSVVFLEIHLNSDDKNG